MYQERRARILKGMSIWGRRADAWFDSKTGKGKATRGDYSALGLQLLGVLVVCAFVAALVLLDSPRI